MARERFDSYMRRDPYVEMYRMAGFTRSRAARLEHADAAVARGSGDEAEAERRLQELFAFGAGEIMVSVLPAGRDPDACRQRTLQFLGEFAGTL